MTKKQILDRISELTAELSKLKAEVQKPETPEPWKPLPNDWFWSVNGIGETNGYWNKNDICEKFFNSGNCFPTNERATQVAEKFRMLLKLERYHDMFCPDYEPDWRDYSTKFFVVYDSGTKTWDFQTTGKYKDAANVWFDSKETAEKVCELLNKEERKG